MAGAMSDELTRLRRHFHANPEVSWEEVETSRFIEAYLRDLGLENVRRGFGGGECGVLADLSGAHDGPCVALRADIDALRIVEQNTFDYRSRNEGAMHACGHDGHAAVLLGAARLLSSMKDELSGRVRFIFQPAEEHGSRSGAAEMVAGGALGGVGAIGGMHLWSFLPTGTVQWKVGPVMAAADNWRVIFKGRGGHGAMPHEAVDPTVAAGAFIGAIQAIVSREVDPLKTVVVSLGILRAGDAFNVIPDSAYLEGNMRTFEQATRSDVQEKIRRIAGGIAEAYRCTAEVELSPMFLPVTNDAFVTEVLKEAAEMVVGRDRMEESPLQMVSEDFSIYQQQVPGTFFFLGTGCAEKGTDRAHHSPSFNVDDASLPTGVAVMSVFALRALERMK